MNDDSRFDFSPPAIEPSAEMRWLLRRAFGPAVDASDDDPGDVEEVWRLARTFNLAPRVAARCGADALREALGASTAERFSHAHRTVVAATLAYEQLAGEVAREAARRSVPLLFLKGFALHLERLGPVGSRPFGDLDVLAPEERAAELHAGLVQNGFRALAAPANERHLPPLAAPRWGSVDLHFKLVGLETGSLDATFASLEKTGQCRPLEALAGRCLVPRRPLLAAHLIVHALRQHSNRPATYPLFRLLADLGDLLPATSDWRSFRRDGYGLIERRVGSAELDALETLAGCLAAGELPTRGASDPSPAGLLLRHILAAQLDSGYREWLRVRHTAARLGEARREGRLLPYLGRKLLAADGDVDPRYGRPRSRSGYLVRKLGRPFHLAWKLGKGALAGLPRRLGRLGRTDPERD